MTRNSVTIQAAKETLRRRPGQAAHEEGERHRHENDEPYAAGNVAEKRGINFAEHQRDEKGKQGGDHDIGEKKRSGHISDVAAHEADDDGRCRGGRCNAGEKARESHFIPADKPPQHKAKEGHEEINDQQDDLAAV